MIWSFWTTGRIVTSLTQNLWRQVLSYLLKDKGFQELSLDFCVFQECGLLRKGSVLLADNVICPGAPEYLDYVRSSQQYESQYFRSHLEYTKVEDGLEKSVFLG